jgi:hypothetical protein
LNPVVNRLVKLLPVGCSTALIRSIGGWVMLDFGASQLSAALFASCGG